MNELNIIPCNRINIEIQRLIDLFNPCYKLKAKDLEDLLSLIHSINLCKKPLISSNNSINVEETENNINITINQDWINNEIQTFIQSNPDIICDISENCNIEEPEIEIPAINITFDDGTITEKNCEI